MCNVNVAAYLMQGQAPAADVFSTYATCAAGTAGLDVLENAGVV